MDQLPLFLEDNTRYRIRYRDKGNRVSEFDCWCLAGKFMADNYSILDMSRVEVLARIGHRREVFV